MKTDWSNYTIAYDGINYSVNYRDNGDLVACENYVANSPTPKNPQPLISNLPAGTYKVQDWRGDWWEFTLDEDLRGIGDVRDSVEWDKYSHRGYLRKKTTKYVFNGSETFWYYGDAGTINERAYTNIQIALPTSKCFCDKYMWYNTATLWDEETVGVTIDSSGRFRLYLAPNSFENVDDFKIWLASNPLTVVCVAITPTRTPLTFTLNNASTAPECPMEFLTNTPSGEYPAEVYDASGTVTARGKNLFDKSKATYGTNSRINETNGGLFPGSAGAGNSYSDYIKISPYTSYKISGQIQGGATPYALYDATKTYIWGHSAKNPTIPNEYNASYVRFSLYESEKDLIQLELGSTATSYEPYRPEVTATIPPLRKVGEIADEFEPKSGKLTRKIGVKVFDGTETWVERTGAGALRNNTVLYQLDGITPNAENVQGAIHVNTHMPAVIDSNWSTDQVSSYLSFVTYTYIRFRVLVSIASDVSALKTWLAEQHAQGTPVTVYYVLAEPVEEQYDPVTLPTYYPTTVITTTNDTPAELTTTATVKVEDEE